MRCEEARKYIDVYVDGELEAGPLVELEAHLEGCEGCRSLAFLSQQLKQELGRLGEVPAPEGLRQRVGSITRRPAWPRRVAIAAAPLAAAAALLLALNLGGEQAAEAPLDPVVADVVQRHVRDLPMEVQGPDPERAASLFAGKVDFPVRAPALKLRNASLQGARISNVRSHQAAHFTYRVDGHRVTLMIFNPRLARLSGGELVRAGGRDVFVGRRNGYNVAVLLDGDMAYALSSDLPRARLLELAADLPLSLPR